MINGVINDIALLVGSGITPLRSNKKYWETPRYPWLKTEQLGEFQIFDTNEYISQAALDETSIKLWPPKTLSVAMYGEGQTRGNTSIIMHEMSTNQACCNIIVDESKVDYRYVYYWLKNSYMRLRTLASGVRKNLNSDDIKTFPISYQSVQIQARIADVLFCLDRKIALNKRINTELEAMAKTIYDYWFVQFDFPDENGKPYRSSGGAMEWNKQLKREIPKGWSANMLGSICETKLGGTPSTDNPAYWNGTIPWLNSGEVASSPVLQSEKRITVDGMNESATSFASAGAVVMSITRYIRPSILGIDACFNQSVVAVIPNDKFRTEFLYPLMLSKVGAYMGLRTGAQQPHINKEIVDSTIICCPSENILSAYYSKISPLLNLQHVKATETIELTRLRDWLLPKLMNGQATVE